MVKVCIKKKLIEEYNELNKKIRKLQEFLNREDLEQIKLNCGINLLYQQLNAMETYREILKKRIDIFDVEN